MIQSALTAFNVSAAVILLQLVQTRIFSVLFWNHLVYFIISIALLGFGVSGTWLALGRTTFLARFLTLRRAAIGFIVSALISSLLVPRLGISIALIFENFSEISRLLFVYFAATLPYFFGGWILGVLFRDNARNIHFLYFSDLIGAAVGCLLYLSLIQPMGAVHLIVMTCLLITIPAMFTQSSRKTNIVTAAIVAGLLVAVLSVEKELSRGIVPEPTKGFSRNYANLSVNDRKIVEFSEWNTISRIDVVSTLKDPNTKSIFIDGDAWTNIVVDPPFNPPPFDEEKEGLVTNASPYLFQKKPESVLVIGAGGGIDVWNALRAGAKRIDALEINPTTSRIGMKEYRSINNDLFHRSGVTLWNGEGRSFVRRTDQLYDVIMIHAIDTFAALNAGAYMLSENYLYTVDAMADYLNHLKPGGTLCITRWMHGGEATRLFTTGLEALYSIGAKNPEANIMGIATGWMTVLLRKSPFTEFEIQKMEDHASKNQALLLFPASSIKAKMQTGLRNYVILRSQNQEDRFFNVFPFDVRPTSDDSPFFFHYEKWKDLFNTFKDRGIYFWIRGNWPSFTLISLLSASLLAVGIFILTPLLTTKRGIEIPNFGNWVIYFTCLGISFIFIEISLMQRFALLLGHPARSIALILGTLLFTAGIGSYASNKANKHFPFILLTLVFMILAAAHVYPSVIYGALRFPLWLRGVVTVALVAPLGFCMGMPFPTGIKQVSAIKEAAVPWMWGINGGTTVLGSLLAIIVAMNFGFTAVLTIAAVGYFVAALSYLRIEKQKSESLPL